MKLEIVKKYLFDYFNVETLENFETINISLYIKKMSKTLKKRYLSTTITDQNIKIITKQVVFGNKLVYKSSFSKAVFLCLKCDEGDEGNLLIEFLFLLEKINKSFLYGENYFPLSYFTKENKVYMFCMFFPDISLSRKDFEKELNIVYGKVKNKYKSFLI